LNYARVRKSKVKSKKLKVSNSKRSDKIRSVNRVKLASAIQSLRKKD